MWPGVFFLTNPDLADILGDRDFDFETFFFWILLDPKFPDFQVPDFQISRNLATLGGEIGQQRGFPRGSISSLGALGEGSGWDLRVRPAAPGNLGTWKSRNLEIWGPGNPDFLRFWDLEIQNVGIQNSKTKK